MTQLIPFGGFLVNLLLILYFCCLSFYFKIWVALTTMDISNVVLLFTCYYNDSFGGFFEEKFWMVLKAIL